MTAGLVRIRSGRATAPEGLLSCCMILHRRGCLHIPFVFGFLLAVFVTSPGEGSKSLWDRQQPPLARLSHSRQRRGL